MKVRPIDFRNNAWQLIPGGSKNLETMKVLVKAERQLYDFVHDDLFVVAAFENYAKAVLLSKRYVVHIIRRPNSLNKDQKEMPIHINTIRSKRNLPNIWFEHYTIGVNRLLKPDVSIYLIGLCMQFISVEIFEIISIMEDQGQ